MLHSLHLKTKLLKNDKRAGHHFCKYPIMSALTWEIIDKFFENGLVTHQIESMDEFIDKKLQQIIQGFNPIQVFHNYQEKLGDFAYKMNVNVLSPALSKPMYVGADGLQMLMTPNMARVNNLTYASSLFVDIHVITEIINDDGVIERQESTIPGVNIGKIPIMVRSKGCVLRQMPGLAETEREECHYDPGGYFIVNGNEKVVISQDRISENKTLVFVPNGNADGLNAEIRSMPDGVFLPPKTTSLHLSGKPNHIGRIIKLSTSFLRAEIPLFVMFRALGVETDLDIIAHIAFNPRDPARERFIAELNACVEDAGDIRTKAQAEQVLLKIMGTTGAPREYLEQPVRAVQILRNTIRQDFLPHVGPSLRKKALYLSYMVRKLVNVHLGVQEYDNRDSYIHKRIDTPGVLFANLFRQCYGKMIKEMRNNIVRELSVWRANPQMTMTLLNSNNIHRFFKHNLIETGLRYALSTGNWGVKTLGSYLNIRPGVAQVLNRMSYLSMLSHLRRINTPMEKNGKMVQPRKLENTQFGMICPCETPEGAAVGLVKNLAMSTRITTNVSSAYIREVLDTLPIEFYERIGMEDIGASRDYLERMGLPTAVHVYINGDCLGFTTQPWVIRDTLVAKKRTGVIPPSTSIVWDIKSVEIRISTEAGRLSRPLYVVENGACKINSAQINIDDAAHMKFTDFIAPDGYVEFLDVAEVDAAMIAMFPADIKARHTHCELHPSLMNGVLAANIPFSDHNQSPRNCYQCLWEYSPVRMADNTTKAIRDICVGDQVICFNPSSMLPELTTVVHQYCRPADKPVYTITTITGRQIIATNDHKFMTNEGWRDLRSWTATTLVGIYADPPRSALRPGNRITMLDDPTMPYAEYFTSHGLFPLATDHPKILVIARLAGYMRGCGMTIKAAPADQFMIVGDIEYIMPGHSDRAFFAFMNALGSTRLLRHPEWLTDPGLSSDILEEYIGGYFGAGGNPTFVQDLVVPIPGRPAYNIAALTEWRWQIEYTRMCEYFAAQDGPPPAANLAEFKALCQMKGTMIMVPVHRAVPRRNCIVADITVASDNHSFIGGEGFTVSNSAMGKQAVGIYSSNFTRRIDTMAHVLNYPQQTLVKTRLSKYTNSDVLPSGINAVVAIMTYSGFNQEDSVMINQSALDRGLFTSTYYKSYREQCSKNHSTGEEEIFTRPDKMTSGLKPANYDKIGPDGLVPVNTYINSQDILIGKVMPHKIQGVIHPRDTSLGMKINEDGHVDMNYVGVNSDGYKFAKVRIRKYRKMTIGDKCASKSAQKGSCGMIYRQADMPYTRTGITPDIIMNPHAIPSRMTIGQLLETIMGKACCMLGAFGDSTPFNECNVEDIADILESYGMERYGNEILYNGRTGEMIRTEIFIGPTYYQRLKHMVADKIHHRASSGPVVMLTRQPAEGRARNGGLRFGEMERDVINCHGASCFLKERMLDVSDNYKVYICCSCGLICVANPDKNLYKCTNCKNCADIRQVRIPYAMKLLLQELTTIGLVGRIRV